MPISYTYTDAVNKSSRPIDPGDYDAKIIGFEFGMASTGTDKLDLTFLVNEEGVELKDSIFFTERAQWKFDLVLKCFAPSKGLGVPEKGATVTVDEAFATKYLMGATGRITTHNEEFPIGSGNERSRVRVFHPDQRNEQVKDTQVLSQQSTVTTNKEDSEDVPF